MLSDGWPLTRQALVDMLAQTQQAGAEFVIIIAPSKEQVYWEQFQKVAPFPPSYDIDQIVKPVREFCAREKLRCIDLAEAFRTQARMGKQLYFPIDTHWNAEGHVLVAQVVEDYLRDAGLLP